MGKLRWDIKAHEEGGESNDLWAHVFLVKEGYNLLWPLSWGLRIGDTLILREIWILI